MRGCIAGYNADVAAQARGLSYEDERREELFEQEYEQLKSMNQAQLDAEVADLEAWISSGRWQDDSYVRNALIYERIDTAQLEAFEKKLSETAEPGDVAEEDKVDEQQTDDWDGIYAAAVAQVNAISPAQRLSELQKIEREGEEQNEAMMRLYRQENPDLDEDDETAGGVVSVFVETMFAPLDLLFIFLALSSAFKIGTGGSD